MGEPFLSITWDGGARIAHVVAHRVVLAAAEQLSLCAPVVDIRACDAFRLAAPTVEVQATDGDIDLRAEGDVALDGETVQLNSATAPRPFAWAVPHLDGGRDG